MTKKITQKPHVDVHDRITSKIIKCIEDGAGELTMPWHSAGVSLENPENVDTKNHYRGINVLSLWVDAMVKGFGSSTWGTYRQWQKQGCYASARQIKDRMAELCAAVELVCEP